MYWNTLLLIKTTNNIYIFKHYNIFLYAAISTADSSDNGLPNPSGVGVL